MQKELEALVDMSFKKFVTPSLAKYIYIAGIALALVGSLSMIAIPWFGILLAPVFFVVSVLWTRACLEFVLAVFQIARYTAEIARRGRVGTEDANTES